MTSPNAQDPSNARLASRAASYGMRTQSNQRGASDDGGNMIVQGGYVDTVEAPKPDLMEFEGGDVGFIERERRGQDPAWHRLGQLPIKEDERISVFEAAQRIRAMEIEVVKAGGVWMYTDKAGKSHLVADDKASQQFRLLRLPMPGDDTMRTFGKPVTQQYTLVQVREVVEFCDAIGLTQKWPLETAGVLFHGEQVFFSFKSDRRVIRSWGGRNDEVDGYLIMRIALDGLHSNEILFAGFRPVCRNTLRWAIKSAHTKVSIVHTANAKRNLELFTRLMTGLDTIQNQSFELMQALADFRADEDVVEQLFAKAFPKREAGAKVATTNAALGGIRVAGVTVEGDTSMMDLSQLGSDILKADDVKQLLADKERAERDLAAYNARMQAGRDAAVVAYAREREDFPQMGPLYLAVQAVTEVADWRRPVRFSTTTDEDYEKKLNRQAYAGTFEGEGLTVKSAAVRFAQELVAAGRR